MRALFTAWILVAALGAPHSSASISIAGRVGDSRGAALAGARAELLPLLDDTRRGRHFLTDGLLSPRPVATAFCDEHGRFRLLAPEAGLWIVRVQARGYVPMDHSLAPLLDDAVLEPLKLSRDAGAWVEVQAEKGTASTKVRVRAATASPDFWQGHEHWRPAPRVALTGVTTAVNLPRAEGEELRLWIFAPGYREQVRSGRDRTVVRLGPPLTENRSLALRDARGRPVEGTVVAAGQGLWWMGLSDRQGRISFPVPTDGLLTGALWAPGGEPERFVLPCPGRRRAPAGRHRAAIRGGGEGPGGDSHRKAGRGGAGRGGSRREAAAGMDRRRGPLPSRRPGFRTAADPRPAQARLRPGTSRRIDEERSSRRRPPHRPDARDHHGR